MASLAPDADALAARNGARRWLRARAAAALDWLVPLWVFSGAMVVTEPSPYELTFLLCLGVALFGGLGLHRATIGLLVMFAAFIPFAVIAAFQVRYNDPGDSFLYQVVTIFLLFTGYFAANYVADAPHRRMRLVVNAYVAAGAFSAILGTLGYLGLVPGGELLTLYGRARGLFQDPNVYGPFLVLPAMYLLQRVLLERGMRSLWSGLLFAVLFVGVFVSFSRAAWAHIALSAGLTYLMVFALEADARTKTRMLVVALLGLLALAVLLAGLLAIPAVQELFEVRTAAQSYDEGETGRFGRQAYAFELAMQNPLGIGPLEFRNLRVVEEPHNSYVNVLLSYGWGGGLVFIALVLATLWRGAVHLLRPSANRTLLIPLVATFVALAGEAAIIDVDHWRHFFLVIGLIWGVTATTGAAPPAPPRGARRA